MLTPASFANAEPKSRTEPNRLGLWVEVEGKVQPFRSRDEFSQFLSFISRRPFTDYYVQIYREGRAWFDSSLVDSAPYFEARTLGYDPLKETIREAHKHGRRVHAWLNIMRVDKKSSIVEHLGRDAVLEDNYGNSLMDYTATGTPLHSGQTRLDTPGTWLDPSMKAVRSYIVDVIVDLLNKYPELDGIHLDMIRFPFSMGTAPATFPYGKRARDQFHSDTGKTLPPRGTKLEDKALRQAWDEWRRAQISRLVFEIREAMNAKSPGKELSAAVMSNQDRAMRAAFQDWQNWLRGGALDYAIPMNYTRDSESFRNNSVYAASRGNGRRVSMGVGAWLLLDTPELYQAQAAIAERSKLNGVTLFSYSNMMNSRGEKFLNDTVGLTENPKTRVPLYTASGNTAKPVVKPPRPAAVKTPVPTNSPATLPSPSPSPMPSTSPLPSPSSAAVPAAPTPSTSASPEPSPSSASKPIASSTPRPSLPAKSPIKKPQSQQTPAATPKPKPKPKPPVPIAPRPSPAPTPRAKLIKATPNSTPSPAKTPQPASTPGNLIKAVPSGTPRVKDEPGVITAAPSPGTPAKSASKIITAAPAATPIAKTASKVITAPPQAAPQKSLANVITAPAAVPSVKPTVKPTAKPTTKPSQKSTPAAPKPKPSASSTPAAPKRKSISVESMKDGANAPGKETPQPTAAATP